MLKSPWLELKHGRALILTKNNRGKLFLGKGGSSTRRQSWLYLGHGRALNTTRLSYLDQVFRIDWC